MTNFPSLSVIVPCYNEKSTILEVIESLISLEFVNEIIIIDDASNDGTDFILKDIRNDRIQVVTHPRNLGKGAAIRSGINIASCDYLVIQDADLEYYPTDIPLLLDVAHTQNADAVFGSRFLTYGHRRAVYYWHRLGNAFLTHFSNAMTNIYLTDMETCYKLMRTKIAKSMDLKENRFGIEPEFTAKLAAVGASVYEVPIRYTARTYEEGKKINWKDGFSALRAIIKYSMPWQKRAMRQRYLELK